MDGTIEWIVSSAVLILAVLALRAVLGNKLNMRLRYALWALVLVRLLVPFSFGSSHVSIQNLMPEMEAEAVVLPTPAALVPQNTVRPPADPTALSDPFAAPTASLQEPLTEVPSAEQTMKPEKTAAPAPLVPGTTDRSDKGGPDIKKVLLAVWLSGAAVTALFFIAVNARFALLLWRSRKKLGVPACSLPVYVSAAIGAPCLFGLFRPSVYVTKAIEGDPVMLSHALAHETTHFRHGDHIFALLRGIAIAVHWFDPLVWLAAVLSRRDSELACDESTIRALGESERADYGRTLIAMTCPGRIDPFVAATMMTGSKKSIQERIKMITLKPKAKLIPVIAVLLASAFAVCCTFTGRQAETPAPDGQQAQATAKPTDAPAPMPTPDQTPEITPEPTSAHRPTEKPTPGPTAMPLDGPSTEEEKQYAEAAYQFVEQIGRIHNKHFSPENTAVSEFYWQPELLSVVFQAEEPGQSIRMLGKPDGNGGYTFSMKDMTMVMLINEFREQEWLDSYSEDTWAAYHESLGEARFIITSEDIAAMGCDSPDSPNYLYTVGLCWQQKYAEFFTSLPENYPGYCYEMLPLDCTVDHYYADQNKVQFVAGFASRPADLRAIAYLYFEIDEGGSFADESYPPEIYGWLVTYGGTVLEQQADGSWVGTTSCHDFG